MTRFLVATNSVHTSAILADYLEDRLDEGDELVVVNSQVGGSETSSEDVRDGEDALNAVVSRFSADYDVETHQFVRGNNPAQDVLAHAEECDADEIVIGVRKRNPSAKVVFGSVAQKILLNANRPIAVVPREEV